MNLRVAILSLIMSVAAATGIAQSGRPPSGTEVREALRTLDHELTRRTHYIELRQQRIDSLLHECRNAAPATAPYEALAQAYAGFNNDSAMACLRRAEEVSDGIRLQRLRLHLASLLPLAGMFESAQKVFAGIDTTQLATSADRHLYYEHGRQMYSYLSAFFDRYPQLSAHFKEQALDMQLHLLRELPEDSDERLFNEGEYAFLTGHDTRAAAILTELLSHPALSDILRARATHHLSSIAKSRGDEAGRIVYLAQSAMADLRSATREVASLQELGSTLSAHGDIDRAYAYLSAALTGAVECGAEMRMLESARSLPYIEQAYARKTARAQTITIWIAIVMAILVIVLIGMLAVLRRDMRKMRLLQDGLRSANRTKELYMKQFLTLCSIYMDKLKQFSKLVTRKIGAGQVDDLYRMAKNGKFVEDESNEFYEVFDDAFLHIYPDFVQGVNDLLRPDERIEPIQGQLNTDLRILAFMRLGIDDTASIAQVLNYSVNTIYAYRNRLRARAIDRDTFEADIMRIGS